MKKLLSILLVIIMLLAIMPLTAFAASSDGFIYELSDNGKYYTLTGYTGNATQVTIPSKYNGKPVYKIGDYAFYKCANITSIIIPDSITAIGDYAFAARYDINDENYTTSSLVRVTMGNSVKTIGKLAFYYCETLTNITLSNALTTIGDYAFARCLRLEKITLPVSLTKLGEGTFAYCFELKSITIPNSVKIIDANAFIDCDSLTELKIPDSVTTIGYGAFTECDSLTSIVIPNSVTTLEEYAFSYCDNLKNITISNSIKTIPDYAFAYNFNIKTISIPSSVKTIGPSAFIGCSNLSSINLPSSVTTIKNTAFALCTSLTSIKIPNSVTTIETQAFYGCENLKTATIPSSVTTVGWGIFYNCYNLANIYCEAKSELTNWDSFWEGYNPATIHWGCKFAKITKQPSSVTVSNGSTAKVSVTATGDGLKYKWYFKDKGASSFSLTTSFAGSSYSIPMNSTRAGRQVYCVITDKYGNSVKTNTVTLNSKVTITKQPTTVAVQNGNIAKVTVTASGDGLTYKWYFKNKGDSKFSLTNTFKSNYYSATMDSTRAGRQVYCVITDKYGNSVKTNTVTLGMAVKITTQPKTVAVQSGKTAKVTVTASGDGLTYKWYFKNKGDSKFSLTNTFKSNTYSATMDSTRAGRQVYCVITDKYGNSVKTNTVTLGMAVKITKQPTSVKVANGKTAKVSVSASGEGKTYKWYFKDKGATKFSLTNSFKGDSYYVTMTDARAGRQIYCVITDKYGNSEKTNVVTLNKK